MKKLFFANLPRFSLLATRAQPLFFTPQFAYHENVIEHFKNPKNVGTFESDKSNIGTGKFFVL